MRQTQTRLEAHALIKRAVNFQPKISILVVFLKQIWWIKKEIAGSQEGSTSEKKNNNK